MLDVLIIGGGPAGATAAIYTARAGLKTAVVQNGCGALGLAERVENFYGHLGISGKELAETGIEQAAKAGADIISGEVVNLMEDDDGNMVAETPESKYTSKAVILASGAKRDTPNIKGLLPLEGRGVSYCAVCDGFFYSDKDVAVLGSGEYALHEVMGLLPVVSSVTLLTDGQKISADFPDTITVCTEKIKEVTGDSAFEGIVFETGESLAFSGLFIAAGIAGGTELARKIGAETDTQGSITVDREMRTSVQGLWAAGDCAPGMKQIAKAVYEGAEAAASVIRFLRSTSAKYAEVESA